MKTHILKVERLERRQMLAADLGVEAPSEPAGEHECVQAHECGEECPGGQQNGDAAGEGGEDCVPIRKRIRLGGPQQDAPMWMRRLAADQEGEQTQTEEGEGEPTSDEPVQERNQMRDRIRETVEPLQVRLRDRSHEGPGEGECDGEGPTQTQAGDGEGDGEGPTQTQAGEGECDGEGPTQTRAGDGEGDGPTQTQAGDGECGGECDGEGPTQTQAGEGEGPIIETPQQNQEQTQAGEQTQSGDCTGDPTQTQQQQQQNGDGEQGGTGDQTQTQSRLQDGSCEDEGDSTDSELLTDLAIVSMVNEDIDPPETRERTGADTKNNPDAAYQRPRDGQGWIPDSEEP